LAVDGDDRAEERTEEPTPRRLQRARRQGEVAFSRDLTAAAGLVGLLVVIASAAPAGVAHLVSYLAHTMATAGVPSDRTAALGLALRQLTGLVAAPLLAVLAGGLVVGLAQTRGLLSLEPLRMDPGRLLPSWRRLLGARALVEVLKGLLKVTVVAALAWLTLRPLLRPLAALPGASAGAILRAIGHGARLLGVRLVAAAVVLGALDLLWQRRRHRRDLRMTRVEVRREHKESEGDPRHKGERQRLHRALAEQQILADVRKADFVVVNPDHLAVALRYDRAGDGAPVVVAKGERLLAEKIKEVAREAGVPIFRDVPLAHALAALEEGEPIPEALYQAVAEILRVVYGMEPAPPTPGPGWRRA
jgi:flagellar biosynthesis protein FlhB